MARSPSVSKLNTGKSLCQPAAKANIKPAMRAVRYKAPNVGGKSQWMAGFWLRSTPTLTEALAISNAAS